jgi:CelD/BcsL family acetyltransferase involved in cellulose biosynthesis
MSAAAPLQVEQLSTFDALPAAYELLWRSQARSFDQTLAWHRTFAEHLLGGRNQLLILGVRDRLEGRAVAILPLRRWHGYHGLLPVRTVAGLSNYYTALFQPVLAPDVDQDMACTALAQALASRGLGWNTLDLNPLAPEHPFFRRTVLALRDNGCVVQPYFRFGNWYLELGGRRFSEYFHDRPSRMRSTLTRKSKKLKAEADVRIEIVQRRAAVDAALAAYERVHARSWKQDEPHKEFIRQVVRRFADEGWLRLGLVHVGGAPAAAQIWFVYGGTASIFKLAHDPAFGELSVGSVLTMTLMEHVIDSDQVTIVDYLCGDDDYKKDWMSHRRERWGLRASPWLSATGMSLAARAAAARLVRLARRQPRREPPIEASNA